MTAYRIIEGFTGRIVAVTDVQHTACDAARLMNAYSTGATWYLVEALPYLSEALPS